MRLDRLDAAGLSTLETAVRSGEPVLLGRDLPSRIPMDEIVPFCHAVEDPALQCHLAPPAGESPTKIAVSIVIPTHRQRPIGLNAWAAQDVETEVLVLANGTYKEGISVPWAGHGATRNRGWQLAQYPYVLFSVDDALPLGAGFVRTMVEALEAGNLDAVTARQVPWPTSDRVTRARLRDWTPPGPRSSPILDNVCALYRRSALVADPFDAVPIAEDWLWGRRHRVGYVPGAPVAHAHRRTFRALYQRTRDLHREFHRAGEPPRVADFASLMAALPSTFGSDIRGALGELLGQYAAAARPARASRVAHDSQP